ncbi:cytochrome b5-like heme/steroid binding domain-containing protein [Mucidula mucida]|nr:cytochrome b5-like heme/steroid binding domain-containing protein [Mucidula mucida]
MTSFLRSWLSGAPEQTAPTLTLSAPEITTISPPDSDDDGEATERENNDEPPAFPALHSAQRANPGIPKILSDTQLMPPPPAPAWRCGSPAWRARPVKKRDKVALAPGHSPLDWAKLKSSGEDLRGVDTLRRIPPSVLKTHNKRDDAWSAFNGKVYNITPYLAFHPGGERELMRVAGRDGTKLFALTHAWVNVEFMLDTCLLDS